jgi:hypothetical protein
MFWSLLVCRPWAAAVLVCSPCSQQVRRDACECFALYCSVRSDHWRMRQQGVACVCVWTYWAYSSSRGVLYLCLPANGDTAGTLAVQCMSLCTSVAHRGTRREPFPAPCIHRVRIRSICPCARLSLWVSLRSAGCMRGRAPICMVRVWVMVI